MYYYFVTMLSIHVRERFGRGRLYNDWQQFELYGVGRVFNIEIYS